jgi:hypothetical protein
MRSSASIQPLQGHGMTVCGFRPKAIPTAAVKSLWQGLSRFGQSPHIVSAGFRD